MGAMPTSWSTSWSSVSVMLSGCTGHPGPLTIGTPRRRAREPGDPGAGRDRLARLGVDAEPCPVTVAVDLLVRDGTLKHQQERIELAGGGAVPRLDELPPG